MTQPSNPIEAVTHPDPYPYYEALAGEKPLYYDNELRMWVASDAATVTAVLSSDLCRVQQPAEPVPAALLGSSAGSLFQRFIRRNDGAGHMPFKQAVSGALAAIDTEGATKESQILAQALFEAHAKTSTVDLSEFVLQFPVYVVGSLLGVPSPKLEQTTQWLRDYLRCLAPKCSSDELVRGKAAAERLYDLFHSLYAQHHVHATDDLLSALTQQAHRIGGDDAEIIVANAIGFMVQACEATAGLIGNTLLALAARPDLHKTARTDPQVLQRVMREVLRFDPPVQNTRRYVCGPIRHGGRPGDGRR